MNQPNFLLKTLQLTLLVLAFLLPHLATAAATPKIAAGYNHKVVQLIPVRDYRREELLC